MKRMRLYTCLFFVIFSFLKLQAQEYSFEYNQIFKVNPSVRLGLAPKVCFEQNENPIFQTAYISTFSKLQITKPFGMHAGYRLRMYKQNDWEEHGFNNDKYRIYGGFNFTIKPLNKDYNISLRYRLQAENKNSEFTYFNRGRIKFEYIDYNQITPYFSVEVYAGGKLTTFEKSKIKLGLDYKINKKVSLETFFSLQTQLVDELPETEYEIGCAITFNKKCYD